MVWRNILPPSSGSKSKPSKKPKRSRNQTEYSTGPAGFSFGLLFDPEDGGSMFLQHDVTSQKMIPFKSPL
jgi:hypothetical protein